MRQGGRDIDTLAMMHRRGSITAGMRSAGERFRELFYIAQLDPLKALDLTRARAVRGGGDRLQTKNPGARIEIARTALWQAALAAGGISQPGGSCLWQVVGLEQTVKQWAAEHGRSQETAAGILICALGALEAHFAGRH